MQQDSLPLMLGVCGLSVVCLTILVVVALVAVRFAGRGFLPILGLVRGITDDEEGKPVPAATPRTDLRQIAQTHDFDSALARQMVRGSTPTEPPAPTIPSQSLPPSDQRPAFLDRHPRSDERRRDYDDEIFGGLLDFDGDGEPDV